MQILNKYFKKEASHDFFYRFLLLNQQMTFTKGFKQNWLSVYKAKYGARKNLSKENWNWECITLRKNFSDLITGIDVWNNFVFAYAGKEFCVFLLDEEDLEDDENV